MVRDKAKDNHPRRAQHFGRAAIRDFHVYRDAQPRAHRTFRESKDKKRDIRGVAVKWGYGRSLAAVKSSLLAVESQQRRYRVVYLPPVCFAQKPIASPGQAHLDGSAAMIREKFRIFPDSFPDSKVSHRIAHDRW